MTDVLILIGTESGTAEMVGECLIDEFQRLGLGAEMIEGADTDGTDLAGRDVVLLCTATHGMGELPSNIQPLADALEDEKPDFSSLRYGVIALGDQTYQETFCDGGRIMDKLFAGLGASRVGERLEIDACTQPLPDEEAVKWAAEWVTLL
jgi:MioC protein